MTYRNRWSSLVHSSTTMPSIFLPFCCFDALSRGRNIPVRAWANRYVALPSPGCPSRWSPYHIATLQAG
jgi:hypothetical protein